MDKKAFQEDILTLTEGKKERRSNTALIAGLMDDIEAALVKGVRREVIYQALLKQGVTLTFQGFESALRELRKKRRAKTTQTRQPTQRPEAPKPTTATLQMNPALVGVAPPSTPSETKPLDIPGNKHTGVDEELKAFKESIKHLPDREKGKKLFEYMKSRADKKSF